MTIKIKDIMAARFTSVSVRSTVGHVEAEMTMDAVRQVLVVDETGKLAGIFSRAELTRAQDRGGRGSVGEFMTRRLSTVSVTDDAVKAAELMIKNHVSVVPVVDDDDRPVGIVVDHTYIEMARSRLAAEG